MGFDVSTASHSESQSQPESWTALGDNAQESDLMALNNWIFGTQPTAAKSGAGMYGANPAGGSQAAYGATTPGMTGGNAATGSEANSKSGTTSTQPTTTATTATGTPLYEQGYDAAIQPYQGELAAPTSPLQAQAYAALGGGAGTNIGNENTMLNNLLSGATNTGNLNAYDALQKQLLGEQMTSNEQAANVAGMLPSTGTQASNANLQATALNNMGVEQANIQQQNVENQLNAATQEQSLTNQQLQAGGTQQATQQAADTAQYNEFIRQLTALGIPLTEANTLATFIPGASSSSSSKGSTEFGASITGK